MDSVNEESDDEDSDAEESDDDDAAPELSVERRRSARIKAGVLPPERLTYVAKIKESEWNKSAETSKAVTAELKQLFHEDLEALKPVMRLPPGQVALESHMFVNQKYKANGDYDKTKARLVADGRDQDTKLYLDKSSPTLQMQSLYTVLAMYAGMCGYCMATLGTKSPYFENQYRD